MSPEEFLKFRDYIYRKSGLYFEEKKMYFLEKRVAARMEATGCADLQAYFRYLRFDASGRELQVLLNLLTVNETYFFREYPQLRCFAEEVLPELLASGNGAGARHLKVWSAGCSTGEEAYTLAIILNEMTGSLPGMRVTWEVWGSDINTEVLARAERGVYDERAVRDVPEAYLSRYFSRVAGGFAVSPELKRRVRFFHLNLLDREAMEEMRGFDAIFCRNVLIYFDDTARRAVALAFHRALKPGGFVFLGHSESMSRIAPIFKVRRFQHAIIYQK